MGLFVYRHARRWLVDWSWDHASPETTHLDYNIPKRRRNRRIFTTVMKRTNSLLRKNVKFVKKWYFPQRANGPAAKNTEQM